MNSSSDIDLYDRSVVASLNGAHITTELAIEALKIAIPRHKPGKGLILHSFMKLYNEEHPHQAHNYQTPYQVYYGIKKAA